jgi:hypothetical protein
VPRADLVVFVTSADRPFTESERAFLELETLDNAERFRLKLASPLGPGNGPILSPGTEPQSRSSRLS